MRDANPVNLGIIGLGAMGHRMLDTAIGHPDVHVVACADPDAAAVSRARQAHPDLAVLTDPDAVLDVDGLDAVYIASPPATHARYALPAMKAGLAVFCEKPLAVDLAEGGRMVAAAAETGAVNALNFALSNRLAAREVARALADGEVGAVRGVEVRLVFPQWPRQFQRDAGWLARREQGGFIREVASHLIFLTDRLLGPLAPVHGSLAYPDAPAGAAETAAALLFHAGDVPVRITGQVAAAPETYEWILYGSARSYRLVDWSQLWAGDAGGWTRVDLDGPRGSDHDRLGEFAGAVRGEASTLADFATGLRVQRAVEHFQAAGASPA